ncbi:hypothetical protein AJ80_03350 [Polytolypa hystricis UAMH7299]|uniref:AB hydrolase-1 domain-containing protein n=1 Tax=Polytolypa hystricis (strain UAMH7299) TaxID=1447883 RepID=A0A2B7YJE4_POLH7|nr:hypothetical protein AJ80_03350 [Polytolypa hystricis UAMH7299]
MFIHRVLFFTVAYNAIFAFAQSAVSSSVSIATSTVPSISPTDVTNHTTVSILPRLQPLKHVKTKSLLEVAYYEDGPLDGEAVILIHGFPHDINVYIDVVPPLVKRGYRVIVPYLRGYGPTRFLKPDTHRSAEQAALGYDLVTLMDALKIKKAILGGYDWGTVVVNVVAALWPERCSGMVAANSYLIQDRNTAWVPANPEAESIRWYFYLFLTARGAAALAQDPKEMARLIWEKNSPGIPFTEAQLDRAAPAFNNPDYVDIVTHFYRNRLLYAPGDPAYATLAEKLDKQPRISVPSVTLDPLNAAPFPATNGSSTAKFFTGPRSHHTVENAGDILPQEAPQAFVDAVLEVAQMS